MRIIFFIGTLQTGGAERQLVNLARGLAQQGHEVKVLTIFSGGANWDALVGLDGVHLHALAGGRSQNIILRLLQLVVAPRRLRRELAHRPPDSLYSMLHLSNLYAWFATRGRFRSRLVWGYRASEMNLNWKRLIPERICAWISPSVPLMIANSQSGLTYAKSRGYRPKNIAVVFNGVDTAYFRPQPELGERLRQEIGVDRDTLLVGIVARLDPIKGHVTFLDAAYELARKQDNIHFVCIGDGPTSFKKYLIDKANELGISDRTHWLGNRNDLVAVYSALDVTVSSSYGEGFSNVIAESMACKTSCVVTDVGDSASIVGEAGYVIQPDDPRNLSKRIQEALQERTEDSTNLRSRIETLFSLDQMVIHTETNLKG